MTSLVKIPLVNIITYFSIFFNVFIDFFNFLCQLFVFSHFFTYGNTFNKKITHLLHFYFIFITIYEQIIFLLHIILHRLFIIEYICIRGDFFE